MLRVVRRVFPALPRWSKSRTEGASLAWDVKSLAIELVTLLDFIIAKVALLSDGLDKP